MIDYFKWAMSLNRLKTAETCNPQKSVIKTLLISEETLAEISILLYVRVELTLNNSQTTKNVNESIYLADPVKNP